MSEAVVGGIAVGACVAAAALIVGTGRLAWKGITRLSDHMKEEIDRIERELGPAPAYASVVDAREALSRQLTMAKASATRRAGAHAEADIVARLAATRHSPLGRFITPAEWATIAAPRVSKATFAATIERAAKRFSDANTAYVRHAITEAAAIAGFTQAVRSHERLGQHTTVFEDRLGRALIADVLTSERGAKVNLDLTGFGDGSCHPVMDAVLRALADRNVRLEHARRRSHYRRDGAGAEDMRRRLALHATERARVS